MLCSSPSDATLSQHFCRVFMWKYTKFPPRCQLLSSDWLLCCLASDITSAAINLMSVQMATILSSTSTAKFRSWASLQTVCSSATIPSTVVFSVLSVFTNDFCSPSLACPLPPLLAASLVCNVGWNWIKKPGKRYLCVYLLQLFVVGHQNVLLLCKHAKIIDVLPHMLHNS